MRTDHMLFVIWSCIRIKGVKLGLSSLSPSLYLLQGGSPVAVFPCSCVGGFICSVGFVCLRKAEHLMGVFTDMFFSKHFLSHISFLYCMGVITLCRAK